MKSWQVVVLVVVVLIGAVVNVLFVRSKTNAVTEQVRAGLSESDRTTSERIAVLTKAILASQDATTSNAIEAIDLRVRKTEDNLTGQFRSASSNTAQLAKQLDTLGVSISARLDALGVPRTSQTQSGPTKLPFKGKIAVTSSGSKHLSVLDETGAWRSVPTSADMTCADVQISPKGDWLVFYGNVRRQQAQVFRVRADGTDLIAITPPGEYVCPTISPDSQKVAFQRVYGALNVADVDGKNMKAVVPYGGHPRWSPDGGRILFNDWGRTYRSDISVVDVTSGETKRLTRHAENEAFIQTAWSPDGTQIAIGGNVYGAGDKAKGTIWVMKSDGSELRNLSTQTESNDGFPSWSPDGKYILFISGTQGKSDVWYMAPDGTGRTRLAETPDNEESVSAAP